MSVIFVQLANYILLALGEKVGATHTRGVIPGVLGCDFELLIAPEDPVRP
jgi:hypothetical protein